MSTESNGQQGGGLELPTGLIATAVVLGLAGVATYFLTAREDGPDLPVKKKPSGNFVRRTGLMALVTLIENDATRKVVVAVLKAMARRS